MNKIMILINDIDPNIYVDNINTDLYEITIIYQSPVSKAMAKKFEICIEKYTLYNWIKVEKKEELLSFAEVLANKEEFLTIISFAEDMIVATEYLKYKLGMKNQYLHIQDITNKFYQRKKVSKVYPELCGEFYKVERKNDAQKIAKLFKFPGILKPISMAGSRLVCKINNKKDFLKAIDIVEANNFYGTTFVLESYFEGAEWYDNEGDYDDYVSVESIVSDGRITHLSVLSKSIIAKPFRETGHIAPTTLSPQNQKLLFDAASKVITALEYKNGPTHIELKLTSSGPKLIEFNPRAGGPVPYMFQIGSDYPIIDQIIRSYLGKDVIEFSGFNNAAAFFSFQIGNEKKCILEDIDKNIELNNSNVKEFYIFKQKGDIIDPEIGTSAMLGFAYVTGSNPNHCINLRNEIFEKMNVHYSTLGEKD